MEINLFTMKINHVLNHCFYISSFTMRIINFTDFSSESIYGMIWEFYWFETFAAILCVLREFYRAKMWTIPTEFILNHVQCWWSTTIADWKWAWAYEHKLFDLPTLFFCLFPSPCLSLGFTKPKCQYQKYKILPANWTIEMGLIPTLINIQWN